MATFSGHRIPRCSNCRIRNSLGRFHIGSGQQKMLCDECAEKLQAWHVMPGTWNRERLVQIGLKERPRLYFGKTVEESFLLEIVRQYKGTETPELPTQNPDWYHIEAFGTYEGIRFEHDSWLAPTSSELEALLKELQANSVTNLILVAFPEGGRETRYRKDEQWQKEGAIL